MRPTDTSAMVNALRLLIAGARARQLKSVINVDALQAFGRKQLTARLATELAAVTARYSPIQVQGVRKIAL